MKKILVVGGSGFLGVNIIKRLDKKKIWLAQHNLKIKYFINLEI